MVSSEVLLNATMWYWIVTGTVVHGCLDSFPKILWSHRYNCHSASLHPISSLTNAPDTILIVSIPQVLSASPFLECLTPRPPRPTYIYLPFLLFNANLNFDFFFSQSLPIASPIWVSSTLCNKFVLSHGIFPSIYLPPLVFSHAHPLPSFNHVPFLLW